MNDLLSRDGAMLSSCDSMLDIIEGVQELGDQFSLIVSDAADASMSASSFRCDVNLCM